MFRPKPEAMTANASTDKEPLLGRSASRGVMPSARLMDSTVAAESAVPGRSKRRIAHIGRATCANRGQCQRRHERCLAGCLCVPRQLERLAAEVTTRIGGGSSTVWSTVCLTARSALGEEEIATTRVSLSNAARELRQVVFGVTT